MPQFDVTTYTSQLFWLALVFSFLYILVLKFVVPRAELIFKTRHDTIETNINDALELSLRVKDLEEKYSIEYKGIMALVTNIKKEAMNKVNMSFEEKRKELHHELDQKSKEVLSDIEKSISDFKTEQTDACINLAEFIIQRITNKQVNSKLLLDCYEKIK